MTESTSRDIVRIGVVGAWMAGLSTLVSGCLEAWTGARAPRLLGIALDDVPVFAGACHAWLLLHGDAVPSLPVMRDGGRPVVGRSVEYEPHGVPIAPMGDERVGELAGAHLAARCSGELLYLGPGATYSERRWRGFEVACRAAGRTARRGAPGDAAESGLVAALPAGSGVFACNDTVARLVVETALAGGRRVPEDVAVVGVDNAPLPAAGKAPLLTTIELPLAEQGRQMGLMLQAGLDGRPVPRRIDVLPAGLIYRATA